MEEAKVIPLKTPEAGLPRAFPIKCLHLDKNATWEEINKARVNARILSRREIQTPTGHQAYGTSPLEQEAKLNYPPNLSPQEILYLTELERFKSIEKKRRQYVSLLLFGNKNASWEEISDKIDNLKGEERDQVEAIAKHVPELQNKTFKNLMRHNDLYALDHVYQRMSPVAKLKFHIRCLRNWCEETFQKSAHCSE